MISPHTASLHTESCEKATTKAECEALAVQNGMTGMDITAEVTTALDSPPGCYVYSDPNTNLPPAPTLDVNNPDAIVNYYNNLPNTLWYNSINDVTIPCTTSKQCLCKNGGWKREGKIKQ